MLMKDTIKITIEGTTGSGKTILANVLREFVEKHGLECKVIDEAEVNYPLHRNWRSHFKNVKNRKVEIKTVQAIRRSL